MNVLGRAVHEVRVAVRARRRPLFHHPVFVLGGWKELPWFAQTPNKVYESDLHCYGCADKRTHESFLCALAEAWFGEVMRAIREEYDLDVLVIQGVGFLGATHTEDGFIHYDWTEVEVRAFNVLIPL